jgi:hypothetical protein
MRDIPIDLKNILALRVKGLDGDSKLLEELGA